MKKILSDTDKRRMYWNIRNRCYNKTMQKDKPKYIGCQMCTEWLEDRQEFYKWLDENYYTIDGEQVDIDKDILIKGNRVYSPDTCLIVPHHINTMFETIPKYTIYCKRSNTYKAMIKVKNKNIVLGYYQTEQEAQEVYRLHKQSRIIALADEYKSKIPTKVYKAIINSAMNL